MANTRVYIVPSGNVQRSAYPAGNYQAVNAPSGLTATVNDRVITLQWTDTNGGASAYVVQASGSASSGFSDAATTATGAVSATFTGQPYGVQYFRVFGLIGSARSASPTAVVSATVAAPSALADGEVVTVSIPGAGSNVAANQFSFLGGSTGAIESGTVGNLFTSIAPSGWDMPGGTGTQISSDQTLNGTRSLLHDRSRGFQFGFAYNTGGIRRVGFARWSFLFQNPNNIQGGQLKQVRFVGGTSARLEDTSYANTLLSGFSGGSVYAARNDSPTAGTNLAGGAGREWYKEGEWITVHYRTTDSSAAGVADASIQVMTIRESTGEILGVWNQNNVLLRTAAAALIRNIVFQFYMGNNFNGASGCKLYLDRDIACAYSDTTTPPKYIMLGNAPTWAACTKRTYCEWLSWTNNGASSAVEIVVNQGYHATLDNLYVYALSDAGTVINSSGVALA